MWMSRKYAGGADVQLYAFLTSGNIEVSGQLHALAALPPRKNPRYTLNGRLVRPQSRCERFRQEEYILSLPKIETGETLSHSGTQNEG
jgi:hypothetical protein